jgi:microcystin-dependent protein
MLTSAGAASTRGASAEADWNDKKRLTLSRTLGRVIGGYGTGSGLSARALGQYLGEEAHSIIANELPEHTHVNAGAAFVTNGAANNIYTAGAVGEVFNSSGVNTTTHSAANVMQPTAFMNFMIKI